MPNAWESAPVVDDAPTTPSPAWKSAPVVSAPSPSPAPSPTPALTAAAPAWQSAPVIDETPAPRTPAGWESAPVIAEAPIPPTAPAVPPGFTFGGDQSIDKLAAGYAPTAPPQQDMGTQILGGIAGDVGKFVVGAGHQAHAMLSGAAAALSDVPQTDDFGKAIPGPVYTPQQSQEIEGHLRDESKGQASRAAQTFESIQSPVARAVAPHVLPMTTMFIPGVGPELAAMGEAGQVYGQTGSIPRALASGVVSELGGRVPIAEIAKAATPVVSKVVGEAAAPLVARRATAAATGAALTAGGQAVDRVADGTPFDPKGIAAGAATFAAFDLGLHALSPVFQEIAKAGGRGMDYLRALRRDFPDGKLPDGRTINQKTVLEAKAAAEEGAKAAVETVGGEVRSSPPPTPQSGVKNGGDSITDPAGAVKTGGAEISPSPPSTPPSTTPDADQTAFQKFTKERDEKAFQQFVRERDEKLFKEWTAAQKPADATPPVSPAEPAPRPSPEQVQPVAEAQQQPQQDPGQHPAGENLPAPSHGESVPAAAEPAHKLPPGFEMEEPAPPHELPAGFEREPEAPADVAEALAGPDAPEPAPAAAPEPPPRVGKLDALDAWAKARLEKLGGVQLRGGAIPIDPVKDPQRLALLAIRGAVHLTKGAVKFAEWSKAMAADVTGLAEEHLPKVFQLAKRIHAMGEEDRAAWAQKQFAVEGTGESVKQSIRRLTGQARPAEVRKQLSDLAVKLKAEASGAREGFKLGAASERNRALTKEASAPETVPLAAAMKARMVAEGRAHVAGAREGFKLGAASERNRALTKEASAPETVPLAAAMKARMVAEGKAHVAGAKEGYRAAVEDVTGVKKELVDVIRKNLPQDEHGQFLSAIAKARTQADISNVIERVDRVVGEVDWREARNDLRDTVKRLDVDKLGPVLKKKAEAFLSPISVKGMDAAGEARLRSLVDFAANDPDGVIPAEMLAAAKAALDKKRPEDMTAEEMRGLDTVLKNIQAQDRLSKKLKLAGKYRQTADAVAEAVNTLKDKAKVESAGLFRRMLYNLPKDKEGNLLADPRKKGLASLAERRLNPDTMALMLDGGQDGLFGHLLRTAPREGFERGMRLFHEGLDHVKEAADRMGMKWGSKAFSDWANERVPFTLEKKTGHVVRDQESGKMYGRKEGVGTSEMSLTRGQRLHLAAMLSDPETRPILNTIRTRDRRHSMGYELTEADKLRFMSGLTEEEQGIVKAMKSWLGGKFMDEQNKVFVQIDGFERLRNSEYFKRIADRSEVTGEPPQTAQSFSRKYLEGLGQYKDRVSHNHPFLVDDAFEVFRDTIQKGSAFVGQGENLHAAWSVLGNQDVRRELANTYGTQILDHIDEFLAAATMVERPTKDVFDHEVAKWSSRAARAMLYRPTTALRQLTGSVTLMADLGVGPVSKAMAQLAAKPSLIVTAAREMEQHSATLRDRYDGSFARQITPQYKDRRSAVGVTPLVDKVALGPMQAMDKANAVLAYLAAKNMGLEGEAAGARAALAISRTQNSSNALDYSGAQLMGRNNTAWRMATLFSSQNEAIYNLLAQKTIRYANGPKDAKTTAAYARDVALVGVSTLLLGKMIDNSYRWATGDEDDRGRTTRQQEQLEVRRARYEKYRAWQDVLNITLGPIASAGVVDVYRKFNGDDSGGGLPWVQAAGQIGDGAKKIEDGWSGGDGRLRRGEQTDRDKLFDGVRRLAKGFGVFAGLPYLGEGVSAVEKGVDLVSDDPQWRR